MTTADPRHRGLPTQRSIIPPRIPNGTILPLKIDFYPVPDIPRLPRARPKQKILPGIPPNIRGGVPPVPPAHSSAKLLTPINIIIPDGPPHPPQPRRETQKQVIQGPQAHSQIPGIRRWQAPQQPLATLLRQGPKVRWRHGNGERKRFKATEEKNRENEGSEKKGGAPWELSLQEVP